MSTIKAKDSKKHVQTLGDVEKSFVIENTDDIDKAQGGIGHKLDLPLPKWMKSGFAQNLVVGFIAFCCPGMFNALQGLGNAGGDPNNTSVAAAMNLTLYLFFALFGVFGGFLFNVFGNKILLSFGGITYCFYAISVYLWGINENLAPLAIVSSGLLGIGAGMFWTAQGAMTLSYATENQKGHFASIFWVIFNLGGVLGGLLTFGIQSAAGDGETSVNASVYFTFCGLMCFGALLALVFVLHPSKVTRSDGTKIFFEKAVSPKIEIQNTLKACTSKYMILLTPLIFQSNFFYTYNFNYVNGLLCDAETRGLNSSIFWGMQMLGAFVIGSIFLDNKYMTRRSRATWGLIIVGILNTGTWAYAAWYQFSSGYDKDHKPDPPMNYKEDSEYGIVISIFMLMGLSDALVQTYAYWIIGTVANSPSNLARYVGYYKGIQSLGACIAWLIEFLDVSYQGQLIACVVLAILFLPFTFVVCVQVKEKGGEDDVSEKTMEY
eukprot:Awhi_evm1s13593